MKRLALVLAVVASLGFSVAALRAQEGAETPEPKKKQIKEKPKPKKPLLRGEYGMMARVCQLSEEQQKKIAEMVPERGREQNQINEKLKAAKAALAEVRKGKDKEAIKKAQDDQRKLLDERNENAKKWQTKILGVLEPEQKAKWLEFTVIRRIKSRFPKVKFTDDQEDKLKAAYVAQTTGVDLTEEKARRLAVNKLVGHVRAKILTDQQRQEMVVGQIQGQFRRAELTEAQIGEINAAYAEQTKGVDPGDEKAWGTAMGKLSRHVRQEILTDAQREAMKRKPPRKEVKPEKRPAEKAKPEKARAAKDIKPVVKE